MLQNLPHAMGHTASMPHPATPYMKRLATAAIALCFSLCAWADDDWPERLVKIEELRPLTHLQIAVPKVRAAGDVTRPAVLKAHVDREGAVRRVMLLQTCGSPAHDEASLHAMRKMKFAPPLIDGQPADVSLVVPLHLPKPKYPYKSLLDRGL